MIYKIEIAIKSNFKERHGEHVKQEIIDAGINNVKSVKYSQIYKISGCLNDDEIKMIAEKLLIDPVTEKYKINVINEGQKENINIKSDKKHEIEVWLKNGVTDTTAESVVKAVKDLGITKEIKVHTGHKFIFDGSITLSSIKHIAGRLLVNPLIQEYKIQ